MISHKLRILFAGILALTMSLAPLTAAHAATARIKDIVSIEGIRDNQLVGFIRNGWLTAIRNITPYSPRLPKPARRNAVKIYEG